ncbi:GATA zinc finger domain-containing protein 1 [Planococcus citri]|uniref:GATA zinc finger domain-containing protein 1 n=1 Tax=Planococcus citri TaxID=170843 RepID=UPI0031F9C323
MAPSRSRKKKTTPEPSCSLEVHDVEGNNENDQSKDCFAKPKPPPNISSSTIPGKYDVVSRVFHNNFLYSVGDIISLRNKNSIYYAQIRVIVEDTFSEKYVAVIWLLPTQCKTAASKDFNPYTFTYGPQDEWFYNLNDVSFVMHPPNQFFKRFIPPVPKNSDLNHVIKYKFKSTAKRKL